jgi:hypothetical protein
MAGPIKGASVSQCVPKRETADNIYFKGLKDRRKIYIKKGFKDRRKIYILKKDLKKPGVSLLTQFPKRLHRSL